MSKKNNPMNPYYWMKKKSACARESISRVREVMTTKVSADTFNLPAIIVGKPPKGKNPDAPLKFRVIPIDLDKVVADFRQKESDHTKKFKKWKFTQESSPEGDSNKKREDLMHENWNPNLEIIGDRSFKVQSYQVVKEAEIHMKLADIDEEYREILLNQIRDNVKRKNVKYPRTWTEISPGKGFFVSTFNKRCGSIKTGTVVDLLGVTSTCYWSTKFGKWLSELNCETVVISSLNKADPVENIETLGFLENNTIPEFDAQTIDYNTYIIPFMTTMNEPDESRPGSSSMLENSTDKGNYFYTNKQELKLHTLTAEMFHEQWSGEKGGKKLKRVITTTIFDWAKDERSKFSLIQRFGIPDPEKFGEFMAANNVPFISIATIDHDETCKAAAVTPAIVVNTREWFPMFQDYLLNMCPKVSLEFILKKFQYSQTVDGRYNLENDGTGRLKCLLNEIAVEKHGKTNVMIGAYAALSSYNGYLDTFTNIGCEFRVLLDQRLSYDNAEDTFLKFQLAQLPENEAEMAILGMSDEFKFQNTPNIYIYAVKPKTVDDEVDSQPSSPKKAKTKGKDETDAMDIESEDDRKENPTLSLRPLEGDQPSHKRRESKSPSRTANGKNKRPKIARSKKKKAVVVVAN